jgi:hypothetical protein
MKDTQTSLSGMNCWRRDTVENSLRIQPYGLNWVLTEISARLEIILNSSISYWNQECDILTCDLTNAVVTNFFSKRCTSNVQNTINKCGNYLQSQRKARNKYGIGQQLYTWSKKLASSSYHIMSKSQMKKIFVSLLTLFIYYIKTCGVAKSNLFYKK